MKGQTFKPTKPLSENAKLKLQIVELKKTIKMHETKQLNILDVSGIALMKDLLNSSVEVIGINGLRFRGTHEELIKQVFDKYCIKYESHF